MDEMISNAEEFYQSLGVAYRIVNIVSGKVYCMYMYVCVYASIYTCIILIYNSMVKCSAFRGGGVDQIAYIM